MEKIALISDIHGNKTALESVLKDIKSKNVKRIFCLGDLDKQFWTRVKIGEERANYLRNLPVMYEFYLSGHLIRLFHASPYGLDYIYNPVYSNANQRYSNFEIKDPLELFKNTKFIGKNEDDKEPDIVGYGHIHTPNLVRFGNKLIFNTGSVGMPNEMLNSRDVEDETNKFSVVSSYTILEGEFQSMSLSSISISNVRVPYDVQKEIEMIENSAILGKEKLINTLKTASTD